MSNNKVSPAFSLDMVIADALHTNFHMQCRDQLFRKKEEGKGFFLHAEFEVLQNKALQHVEEGNYVAAANYCMMLHQQQQLSLEQAEFFREDEKSFLER